MVPAQIIEHLQHILSEESVGYDDESLALLARGAEGSMRDALSLTDQAIAHGSGKLAADEVRAMLGTVSRTKVLDLLAAIADNDAKQALAVVDDLATHSPDYSGALDELSWFFTKWPSNKQSRGVWTNRYLSSLVCNHSRRASPPMTHSSCGRWRWPVSAI